MTAYPRSRLQMTQAAVNALLKNENLAVLDATDAVQVACYVLAATINSAAPEGHEDEHFEIIIDALRRIVWPAVRSDKKTVQ